jgi:hypothetical protein
MCDGLGGVHHDLANDACAPYRCRVASGHCLAGCATDDDCRRRALPAGRRCGFSSDADGAVD